MSPAFVDNDGNLNWRKIGYHARSAFAVLLSTAILVGGGWFVYSKINEAYVSWRTAEDYIGEGVDDISVVVPLGATITNIGDILVENDVIKSTATFRDEAAKNPDSNSIQAGRYNLKTQIPAALALEMLLDPANLEVTNITIPEGMALGQQWTVITRDLGIPREDIAAAFNSGEVALPEMANGNFEGFMFPDTYQVAEPVNPLQIAQAQVAQFKRVATELEIETRASQVGMTPFEIITVASIIEKEVATPEYRPMVARAIYNRLDQGMKLQVDSSVHFALGDFSKVTTTAEDRAFDSPYNTYLYEGLPPGAISSPGRAAIEAALTPSEGDYVFWVTVNLDTGETRFAATAEEHEANVALFQQWCQANTGRCV
ncbi:endolytic transglycosylase MltG [Tessaracoccus terricola]